MTVLAYHHDHLTKQRLAGYRAVRTVGRADDYRQKFYPLNRYGNEAKKLAQQMDDRWAAEAKAVLKKRQFSEVCRSNPKTPPHIIVAGFRAKIVVDKKYRENKIKHYFSPSFAVKIPGYGKGEITFRIRKHGYRGAFIRAAKKYAAIHQLPPSAKLALIAKEPPKTVFTEGLLKRLRSRGYKCTKKSLFVTY